jgi:hypothetical protein
MIFLLIVQSFSTGFDYEVLVHPNGQDLELHIAKLYEHIDFAGNRPGFDCFKDGLKGYYFLKMTGELNNSKYLTLIDFSMSSKAKRLWVIDVVTRKVVFNELSAHGKNSGEEFATRFSNNIDSYQSSLGFYVTGDIYKGSHDLSVKMHGLERGYNNNAFKRGIVFHGASYVDSIWADKKDRIGRSFGCPAVRNDIIRDLSETIANGSCVFFYFPDKDYLKKSSILNNDQYLPLEWLSQN